jgi:hypothetical protein
MRRPKLSIVWQKALDLPRFTIPKMARVFASERWTGAPLVAGFTVKGGACRRALGSGESRRKRLRAFPFLLHALADLGMEAPSARRTVGVFRLLHRSRVDLEYFAPAGALPAFRLCMWPRGTSMKRILSATATCAPHRGLPPQRHHGVCLARASLRTSSERPSEWREKIALLRTPTWTGAN